MAGETPGKVRPFVVFLSFLAVAVIGFAVFKTARSGPKLQVGELRELTVEAGGRVPVAATEEALEHFREFSTAHDQAGMKKLVDAGLVWEVPSGIRCRLLTHSDAFIWEVRAEMGGVPERRTWFVWDESLK